jgi:two-component system CheB/CheR fusion protein
MDPDTPSGCDATNRIFSSLGEADEAWPGAEAGVPPGTTPVVALAGSAGCLEALQGFLSALPLRSGAGYVVIQHLAPDQASLLPEVLSACTSLAVVQARDGMPVRPDQVHVIPPGHHLELRDGALWLTPPPAEAPMVIDAFLRSLAAERGERAIAILFSGIGPDGTQGARTVRSAGGMVMAQDPRTAQFPALPGGIAAAGLADHLLAPERMPECLMRYLSHPYARGEILAHDQGLQGNPEELQAMLALVEAQSGVDFRSYKKGTVLRRIERRMGLHGLREAALYRELLEQDPMEVKLLLRDLLINVTAFFRDPEAFQELQEQVIVPLVRGKAPGQSVRVWVPGCASGEEAYSVAILLLEQVAAQHKACSVQVFATDIDEEALETARRGRYAGSVAGAVGPARLARFFLAVGNGYQVNEALRKAVTFASHNLLTDPPFSRMDLVSCRNLLIYLETGRHAQLMALFNFTLAPGGTLFLGKSETVGCSDDLFEPLSKQGRVYRWLNPAHPLVLDPARAPGRRKPAAGPRPAAAAQRSHDFGETVRQAILAHFGACVALVDRRGQFLQFHGQTGRFLKMPAASPTFNLLDLAREELPTQLRLGLRQAFQDGGTVVLERVRITEAETPFPARVSITRIAQGPDAEPVLAVFFEEIPRSAAPALPMPAESESVIRHLEDALRATQQDLQATIQELQAANEALRVANEEVSSSNEELQSTNEELETAAEEVQSTNEELTAVNSQLQGKVEQLDEAYNDMANLLNASEIASVFLDQDLRIKFFTPAMSRVLDLIPADRGRPITQLALRLAGEDLAGDARTVLRDHAVIERNVQHPDGPWYLMRVMPYRTHRDLVDGVVITLSDVTLIRREDALALQESHDMLTKLSTQVPGVIFQLRTHPDGRTTMPFASQGLLDSLEAEPDPMRESAAPWFDRIHPEDRPGFQAAMAASTASLERFHAEYRVLLARQGLRWRLTDAQPERLADGSTLWHGYTMDITGLKQAEAEKAELAEQLNQSQRLESLGRLAGGVAHDMNNVLAAILSLAELHRLPPDASPAPPPLARSMATIASACTRGRDLVKSLLFVARKDLSSLEPLDLNGLARDMVQLLEHTLLKKVRIVADLQEPLARILGDGGALSHALMNLCVNAQDAMPHGGTITIRSRQEPEGTVALSVIDTGLGMTPEVAQRAMEPFYTTKPHGKGTGLGLAMVYGTLQAHRATIDLRSAPGEGTEVLLRFPPMPEAQPVPAGAGPQAPSLPAGAPLSILLVDDDELILEAIPPMLRMLGHRAETAAGGQEALERCQGGLDPDLVILDMNMPGLSGSETLDRLLAWRPCQAVLLASGYNDQDIGQLVLGHRNVFALQKPFTLDELRDKLAAIRSTL